MGCGCVTGGGGYSQKRDEGGIKNYVGAVNWTRVNVVTDPMDLDDSPDGDVP